MNKMSQKKREVLNKILRRYKSSEPKEEREERVRKEKVLKQKEISDRIDKVVEEYFFNPINHPKEESWKKWIHLSHQSS